MSRILIAYASSHGQTRAIAQALAARLETGGHTVELCDAALALPGPAGFDGVILGSRVQNGRHGAAIERYARVHRLALAALPSAFFSVSMSAAQHGAGPDPNGYLERFFTLTGWRPACFTAFGGALKYTRYGWLLRRVMRFIARRGGHATDLTRDHHYTDWAAVARFGEHVAGAFRPPACVGSAA